jgi:hypothetical protein
LLVSRTVSMSTVRKPVRIAIELAKTPENYWRLCRQRVPARNSRLCSVFTAAPISRFILPTARKNAKWGISAAHRSPASTNHSLTKRDLAPCRSFASAFCLETT